jgi:ribosomal protein S18 acetylase RimI-like enzyme
MISVREARPGDGAAILRMTEALAESHNTQDLLVAKPEDYEAALFAQQPIVGALIAEIDGVAAGSAFWHRSFSTNRGRELIYLEDLAVLPAFRRRGVAEALMRALAQLAVDRGFYAIYWFFMDWNEAGRALYAKLGAEIISGNSVGVLKDEQLRAIAR